MHQAFSWIVAAVFCCVLAVPLRAAEAPVQLDDYDVIWNSPGASSADSMPVGNGDIGLNVWVEKNGDLLFYIGKGDAWSGDLTSPGYGAYGLIKVGRVRVSLSPSPFADLATFRQTLRLRRGAVEIGAGKSTLTVWVDANRSVIHVEAACEQPVRMTVKLESWRTVPTEYLGTDTILAGQKNRVVWYYLNPNKEIQPLVNRTIGAAIEGDGLVSKDSTTLESANDRVAHHVAVHPLTAQCPTPQEWLARLDRQIAASNAVPLEQARRGHLAWWSEFWGRSWIFLSGGPKAREVTSGYLLQRFKNACTSRGEFPMKFNGSIFNVDAPKPLTAKDKVKGVVQMPVTADYRNWGHQYWFQNTRPMYWPLMMSGDFDLMQPLFRMYRDMLPANAKQVREFYGHDGAYFRETAPFWGGLIKITPEEGGYYTKHYYTPILELSTMMLDYYAYTGDREFIKKTLLPVADAGLTFYSQHFKRDASGKLLISPANAIEMFWKVRNPLPDIAGLRVVLQGLLALPPELTEAAARQRWQRFLAEIPPVPTGVREGKTQLLPFEEGQKAGGHNSENPELYAIYPFRLYGLGKPELEVARNAFAARKFKGGGCWSQNAVQAALVGDVTTAQKLATVHFTRKDGRLRFPAFWAKGFDYAPDEDNGGNGLHALQLMLLQGDGKCIRLLPAWPADWDAEFKLHATLQTTVEGTVRQGKLVNLKVTPESRRGDVIIGAEGTKVP